MGNSLKRGNSLKLGNSLKRLGNSLMATGAVSWLVSLF